MKPFRKLSRLNPLREVDPVEMMRRLGVEPRRSATERALPPAAGFGVGFIVGMGVGVLLAPKAGKELRDDLRAAIANWGKTEEKEPEQVREQASETETTGQTGPLTDEPTDVPHRAQA